MEAVDQLDTLLNDAVSMRMEADVPLGAFLSGGIDSSLVVAIMQANSDRPVKTFTIGFDNSDFNEAESAKAVAKHLGTDHTELYVTPEEAMAVIPRLPTLYDEPFADSSQIPTFLVSQLARRNVTVSLSGDGGDELFGGYNTYLWGRSVQQNIGWMPRPLKTALAKSLNPLARFDWNSLLGGSPSVLPQSLRRKDLNKVLQKLAGILKVNQREALYWVLCSYWMDPASVVIGAKGTTDTAHRSRQVGANQGIHARHDVPRHSDVLAGRHSGERSIAHRWASVWSPACLCWITGSWSSPGGCHWR